MSTSRIALYVTPTMADWEYAYLTAEIARAEQERPGRVELVLVGDGIAEVLSLGGMPVRPTLDVADLSADGLAALVIPGADTYVEGHEALVAAVRRLLDAGTPVAAICGATLLLARAGLLDEREHTSNAAEFLAMSGYAGGDRYVDAPVVTDRGITTGSGIHPVPFTAEIMRVTRLYPDAVVDPWERLYTTGQADAFFALMEAKGAWANA